VAEFDSVIPAGGSGTLTARVKTTTTQSGPVSKSIAVTTDAEGAQRLRLNVTFKSVTAVSVLPRPQLSLSGVYGDELTSTVILRRTDGEKLEITGIENTDPRLVITTRIATENLDVDRVKAIPGDVMLIASVAPDIKAGMTNGRLKIKTNHPDAEVIVLAYTLRLRPVIEARPAQIRLLLQEGNDNGRTALFRLQHNRRGRFKLIGAKASNPDVFRVQLVDGDVKQQVHTIAIMLQDEVLPGSLDGRLVESLAISTDDAGQPELTIPVLIEPRALRRPGSSRPLK